MKKILGIIVLGLLLSGNAYANNKLIQSFNSWLSDNGYHQYLEKIESETCKSFDKGDTNWYYNNCDEFQGTNNLKIKFYKNRSNIPWNAKPNFDTLLYYLFSIKLNLKS